MAVNPNTIFSGLTTLADFLLGFTPQDVVGVFDGDTLQQVFVDANILKAGVREGSTVMKHPVETGTMIADNSIINQIEINLPIIIKSENYASTYNQIKQAYIARTKLSVQTRTGVYPNMIIADLPHEEDAELYDAVTMGLHFTEVQYVVPTSVSSQSAPANFSPLNPVDSNTVQAGLKYPGTVSTANVSAVQAIFTGAALKSFKGF